MTMTGIRANMLIYPCFAVCVDEESAGDAASGNTEASEADWRFGDRNSVGIGRHCIHHANLLVLRIMSSVVNCNRPLET